MENSYLVFELVFVVIGWDEFQREMTFSIGPFWSIYQSI